MSLPMSRNLRLLASLVIAIAMIGSGLALDLLNVHSMMVRAPVFGFIILLGGALGHVWRRPR